MLIVHLSPLIPHRVAMGADNSYNLSSIVATEKVERPLRQFANSEAIVALAWLPSAPTALAAGTGSRWLRIYDLRGLRTNPV